MGRARTLWTVATVVVSAGLLAGPGVGPVTAEAPADQATGAGGSRWCVDGHFADGDCYYAAAQTLTVGRSGPLVAVDLYLSRSAATSGAVTVELRENGPSGAILATSRPVALVGIPPDWIRWVSFDFPSAPPVTAGDVIAIVIPFVPTAEPADRELGWGRASHGYAGGVPYGGIAPPDSWEEIADGGDFAFVTYVADDALPATSTASEVSSGHRGAASALLVLGATLVGLALAARRLEARPRRR